MYIYSYNIHMPLFSCILKPCSIVIQIFHSCKMKRNFRNFIFYLNYVMRKLHKNIFYITGKIICLPQGFEFIICDILANSFMSHRNTRNHNSQISKQWGFANNLSFKMVNVKISFSNYLRFLGIDLGP